MKKNTLWKLLLGFGVLLTSVALTTASAGKGNQAGLDDGSDGNIGNGGHGRPPCVSCGGDR